MTNTNRTKNIIEVGLFQGWSTDNIVSQIMFEIANEEEAALLCLFCDVPELKAKAECLYSKHRDDYYSLIA